MGQAALTEPALTRLGSWPLCSLGERPARAAIDEVAWEDCHALYR